MRILVLSTLLCEGALQELGHDVKTCSFLNPSDVTPENQPCSITDVLRLLPRGWEPDVVVLGDESLMPLFVGLEFLETPLVWWAVDSHIQHSWHPSYASLFEVIFVAQKDFLSSYLRDPERQVVEWLPLHSVRSADVPMQLPRVHPVSFVGSMDREKNPARVRFMEQVRERIPLHVASGSYQEIFHSSQMVLNQCLAGDVNLRTFEAMACGALLLMERVGNGLGDLFSDRIHMVLYEPGNVDEVVDHVGYYGSHEAEREEIAACGRAEVLAKHTDLHRAQRIIEVIEAAPLDEMVRARVARLGEFEAELIGVYDLSALVYKRLAASSGGGDAESFRRIAQRYELLSSATRESFDR